MEKTGSGLSRRALLVGATSALGLTTGGRSTVASEGNLPPNVPRWSRVMGEAPFDPTYGRPILENNRTIRREFNGLPADRYSVASYTPLHELSGVITSNPLCFVRNHAGVPMIDVNDHRLIVHGMVETALTFGLEDIKRFPSKTRTYFLECAGNSFSEWEGAQGKGCQFTHGLMHNVAYTGVLLRDILNEAGLKHGARWILGEGADSAAMDRSIPIEKAMDDCMVVYAMNGEALYPEHGAPLRLLVPGWEGNISVKWLRRVKVGDRAWNTREETAKYTSLLPSGQARQFAFVMDAKSVITSPSPQSHTVMRGFNMLSGLAWSGRGRIARVDVSLDGGRNWFRANLDGPVTPKAWVRFNASFDWQGHEMNILSRAMDETGYTQPSLRQLTALRGIQSFYHNNAIQSWHIRKSGDVENI